MLRGFFSGVQDVLKLIDFPTYCRMPSIPSLLSGASFLLAVVAAAAVLLAPAVAFAGSMESVSLYGQYKALSNNPHYRWAGAATMRRPDIGEVTASCVAVAPTMVIGAGHFTPGPTAVSVMTAVTFGASYKTGERLVMEVARWEQFPGYIFGDKTTTDLGIYYLKQPIPGFTPVTLVPESPPLGTVLTMVDYGNYGDTTTGELPTLGDRLAGKAQLRAYSGGPDLGGYPLTEYAPLYFHPISGSNYRLRTQGLQYSSGSPWFDENGRLAFISIAIINGQMDRYTVSLRLSLPEIQAWLQPKIAASWAAVTPQLSMTTGPGAMRLTWDAAATGYRLQTSESLSGWTNFGELLTGPGTLDDLITAARPNRFYRLATP